MKNLTSFIQSRFYHTMDVFSYTFVTIDGLSEQTITPLISSIPCFFSRHSSPVFTTNQTYEEISYSGKIYFPIQYEIPPNSLIHLYILDRCFTFIFSDEEILYPTHKEIFVKRKEIL